ncbi:MAG: pullulanase-type alpha-1,6-glucosidase [Myxococcota bacterium]
MSIWTKTTVAWSVGMALIASASACGGDDAPAMPDAGAMTDTGATPPDAGDAGTVEDMGTPPEDMGTTMPTAFAVHYHRPDLTYAGWSVVISGDVENPGTIALTTEDDFGAVFEVTPTADAQSITFQLTDGTTMEPAMPLTVSVTSASNGVWWFHGAEQALTRAPPAIPGENQVAIYYVRGDEMYSGWGLHLWGDVVMETAWQVPARPGGTDGELGSWWIVDVQPDGDRVNLIVHMGDIKDPGPDMGFDISMFGDIVFLKSGSADIFTTPQDIPAFQIDGMSAHWVSQDSILYALPDGATQAELRWAADASIRVNEALDVEGGQMAALTPSTDPLPTAVSEKFPHLTSRNRLVVPASAPLEDMLRSQLVVVARDDQGTAVGATRVQIPGVLDELYAYDGDLGATFDNQSPTLRVWAPTAQSVELIQYDDALTPIEKMPMDWDASTGTWSLTGDAGWYGRYYRYEVTVYHPATDKVETLEVTDPYSVSLSANSQHSQIIDLRNDAALKPQGWDTLVIPPLAAPEDVVIYEGHVRDFSISDTSVPVADRGKYLAFTHNGQSPALLSAGMAHLQELAAAGLTIFHILPAFDIATVVEDPAGRVDLDDTFERLCMLNGTVPMAECVKHGATSIREVLASLDPTSGDAQQIVTWMKGLDGFNWGYDPYHYTTPEGSYASTASGTQRILEFRQMVMALAQLNLRTALDVVYNHTNASGISTRSVLDKVVPGYYHRLNADTGSVERSTCCDNTASEFAMMEKLMVDSLLTWAQDYKVGAFRFDLMGHHMVRNMQRVRAALDQVDPQIYVYGEGWDFGEVQGGQRGLNATQLNLAGTGIGTFNDRIRDAVRGGGPFDSGADNRATQGFATGLFTAPNESNSGSAAEQATLLELSDLIRIGMAGNLRNFPIIDRNGSRATGRFVPYNGAQGGYTLDPQESVNYVSKHDNQTFFDIGAYKMATGTTMADRTRRQNLAMDVTVLGQGVPFLHMGVDLLRSKSMERDSFDSGDWFNVVDWTRGTNNWNVGLPNAEKDQSNWPTISPIIQDAAIAPTTADITFASTHLREVLRIRSGSPLFRLQTEADVQTRVDYHNVGASQVPGMIVQSITDGTCAGNDLDPQFDAVLTVINGTPSQQVFELTGASGFILHPTLQGSADTTVQGASFGNARFTVPALTTAVFVQPQAGAQGSGLPCNTR